MVLGKLDIHMQKSKVGPYCTTYTKLTQNGSKTNMKAKTIKHLE